MAHNLHNTLREFQLSSGSTGRFYSLPALEQAGVGRVSRLPVSIRIVLESVLRNCDGKKVTEEHVRALALAGKLTEEAFTARFGHLAGEAA